MARRLGLARLRRGDGSNALRLNVFWQFGLPCGPGGWLAHFLEPIAPRLGDDIDLFGGSAKLAAAVSANLAADGSPIVEDRDGQWFQIDRADAPELARRALDRLADAGLVDDEIRAAAARLT